MAIQETLILSNEGVADNAISHRISKLNGKDFEDSLSSLIKPILKPTDHEENLKKHGNK